MKMIAQPITSLADRFPAFSILKPTVAEVDAALVRARTAALALDWSRAAKELAWAGKLVAKAQAVIAPPTAVAGIAAPSGGIEYELARERARIDHALTIAAGVRIIAQAD